MTSNHTKSLIAILSLILVILVAVIVLGIYDMRAKNKETSRLLNLADEAAQIEVTAQSIRATQNDAGLDLETFDSLILSSDRLVTLIEDVEDVGRRLDLGIETLSVVEVNDSGSKGSRTVRIVMETDGSWSSTLSFIRAVENLPHRVLIDETSLTKKEDGWNLRMAFSLYLFD